MPKIGNVEWSEKDTKSTLVEKAVEAGLPYDASMTKADLIEMMHTASDEPATVEEKIVVASHTEPTAKVKLTTPREDPTPVSKPTGVLAYLKKAEGKRVAFTKIVRDCGPNAKEEIKKLLAEGKLTQFKQHNRFFFKLV